LARKLTQHSLWALTEESSEVWGLSETAIAHYETGARVPTPRAVAALLHFLAQTEDEFHEVLELLAAESKDYVPLLALVKSGTWTRAQFEEWASSSPNLRTDR
jgi:transcriptional regulator with XRE-family HTH domain